jgi:hypothetical protein
MLNYNSIKGWFDSDDANFYEIVASGLPNNARMLEVGAYKGRSAVCMSAIFAKMGKNITIDVVDNFGGDEHIGKSRCYKDVFIENTKHCPIGNIYHADSMVAHTMLRHKYDFIFIDACHLFGFVVADITNYLPHLNETGVIGGHDLLFYGVREAVGHVGIPYVEYGNCWLYSPQWLKNTFLFS